MKKKSLVGKVWPGFITECEDKCPYYIIPRKGADGIFICDILKKVRFKKIKITIEPL